MGNRYSGAFPPGDKADEVFDSRHRVLHEVDRGRTSGTDHCSQGTTLCLEEHCVSFRGAKASHLRQWHSVRELTVREAVCRSGNQAGVRINRTPQTNGQVESANRVLLRRRQA